MSVATFPIGYPTSGFVEADFQIIRRQAAGMLGNGRDIVIDRGIPQWKAVMKTKPLFAKGPGVINEVGLWRGFRDSLRGGSRFFLGYDPFGSYPSAYMPAGWGSLTRAGGGAFTGTATLTSIANSGLPGVGRDVVSIGTLPIALSLIAGDYLSLSQSGIVSLHRILDQSAVAANGSGVATVWVEPEIPANFTTSAAVNLLNASAKFRLSDFALPVQASGRNRPGQATFTALSTLL